LFTFVFDFFWISHINIGALIIDLFVDMFDFIQKRSVFYTIAAILMAISLGAIGFLSVNLGIDMTGGISAEFNAKSPVNIVELKTKIEALKPQIAYQGKTLINNITLYNVSGGNSFIVEAGFQKASGLTTANIATKKEEFKKLLSTTIVNDNVQMARYSDVGESFGDYIKQTAYLTLFLVIFFISLYIAWAFKGTIEGVSSFSFAAVTAASLFHDVLLAFGFYMIASHFFPEFKIDTYFITAMLTVLGYSVSDTIVIMDRIRYNLGLKELRKMKFSELINSSINETLTRSIYTSLSVFLVLLTMFFFGPESIRGFVLAMLFGTIFGTYSSIAIAAPLLYDMNRDSERA